MMATKISRIDEDYRMKYLSAAAMIDLCTGVRIRSTAVGNNAHNFGANSCHDLWEQAILSNAPITGYPETSTSKSQHEKLYPIKQTFYSPRFLTLLVPGNIMQRLQS